MLPSLIVSLTEKQESCECCGGYLETLIEISSEETAWTYGRLESDGHFGEGDDIADPIAMLKKSLKFLGYDAMRRDDLLVVSRDKTDLLLIEIDALCEAQTKTIRFLDDFATDHDDDQNVALLAAILSALGHKTTLKKHIRPKRATPRDGSERE